MNKNYVKEIPCYRVNYIEREYKENHYTLLLPHLVPEFNNDDDNYVAVNCMPIFPPSNIEEEQRLCEYITNGIKDSFTKIIFDNVYEGHTTSCIHGIYKIIDKLNLDYRNCYFISGAMEADKRLDFYCRWQGITNKINIIMLNSWERHIFNRGISYMPQHKIQIKDKNFLCFNRVIRPHRAALLGLLYSRGLVEKSFYSFFPTKLHHGSFDLLGNLHNWFNSKFTHENYKIIEDNILRHYAEFPLLLNNQTAENTNTVLRSDKEYYENSYFSLVTETFFFGTNSESDLITFEENSIFFSEKIFKPIICKHPFILVSRPRSLEYLRKIGYKTFHPLINESYDQIENDEQRMLAIVNEVERLSLQSDAQWLSWLSDIRHIVEFNYNILMNKKTNDFIFNNTGDI